MGSNNTRAQRDIVVNNADLSRSQTGESSTSENTTTFSFKMQMLRCSAVRCPLMIQLFPSDYMFLFIVIFGSLGIRQY